MDTEPDHLGVCLVVVQNEVLKVALRQATKDVDLALNKNKGWSGMHVDSSVLFELSVLKKHYKKQNTTSIWLTFEEPVYIKQTGKQTNLPSWKWVAKTLQENLNNSTTRKAELPGAESLGKSSLLGGACFSHSCPIPFTYAILYLLVHLLEFLWLNDVKCR